MLTNWSGPPTSGIWNCVFQVNPLVSWPANETTIVEGTDCGVKFQTPESVPLGGSAFVLKTDAICADSSWPLTPKFVIVVPTPAASVSLITNAHWSPDELGASGTGG